MNYNWKPTNDSNNIRLCFPVSVRRKTNCIVRSQIWSTWLENSWVTSPSSVLDILLKLSAVLLNSLGIQSTLKSVMIKDITENIHCFLCNSGLLLPGCMISTHDWKWSSAHALGGVSGVASFITVSIKPRLLFFYAGYASWGLFLYQFNCTINILENICFLITNLTVQFIKI